MTRIVERAKALLPAALHAVVQARMEEGREKYGQELDEWPGTPRRAAIMRLQELLDGVNYALFEGDDEGAQADAAQTARILARWPDLTPEEMGVRETTLPPIPALSADQPTYLSLGVPLAEYQEAEQEILCWNPMDMARFAHLWRAGGHDIAPKMEAELGYMNRHFLGMARQHGMKWREVASAELKEMQERRAASTVQELPDDQ
ncbi:hypothetical protein [Deinococcus marmoris]|uniref:Uncharacterized protein n=1 Tax=Deinococcus marmoris TaxID=249408 RepID=A0A1U7P4Q4_9DEIO|nr:hypothetical protein [Deinococcus marmoris]OLV20151.1 hypothetical protein BOO71_0000481 [Deinococcus marmoris]